MNCYKKAYVYKERNKRTKYHLLGSVFFKYSLRLILFASIVLICLFLLPQSSFAATAIWTNGGGDGLWSTCTNWSGGTGTDGCPGVSDIATFNDTYIDNIAIDANISVAGISIVTGYTGQITQNSTRSITVGSSNFTQVDGTFIGGDSPIDINGDISITGGVFTSTSNILTIERSLIISTASFNHNSGTVTFDGSYNSNSSIDASGVNFNLININRSFSNNVWSLTFTIASGTTIPLGDSPSLTLTNTSTFCCGAHRYHLINNGTINVATGSLTTNINGDFTNNGIVAVGTGTLTTNVGGTFTNNGTISGSNTAWVINGDFSNSSTGTVTMSSATTFDVNTYNSYKISIYGNFTNNADSIFSSAANPTFNVSGSFIIDSSSTFPANATLTLDGDSGANTTVDASGYTFATPVTINRLFSNNAWSVTLTIASGTTIPLGDSPSVTLTNTSTYCCGAHVYNLINNGTITFGTTGTLTTNINGLFTNNGTISGSNTAWVINGDFTNSSTGTLTMSSATTFDVNAYYNSYNCNTGTFRNDSGSIFTSPANPIFSVNGSFIIDSSSTFPANAILTLDGNSGASTIIDAPGYTFTTPVTINRFFSLGSAWSQTLTITSGTTIPLGDSPVVTLTNTSTNCCGSHVYNLVNNGIVTIGTGSLTTNINGTFTNNGTIIGSNTNWTINGDFTNSSTGIVTMSLASTFGVSAYYNYYSGNSGSFTNNSGATFSSALNPIFSATGNITINVSSTFPTTLVGLTLNGSSGTQTVSMPNVTNYGVLTKSANSTFTSSSDMTVSDLIFSGGTIGNPASPYSITMTGNFNQSSTGIFGGSNLTLIFSGSEVQTISKTAGTFSSNFQVDKSGSYAQISSTSFVVTTESCDVIEGTFDLNGKTFSCGGIFTIQDGGKLEMVGLESSTTPTLDYNSTVLYRGDGDSLEDIYDIKDWSYSNLEINLTDTQDILGPGVLELVSVDKNLTITQGVFNSPDTLTIGGNFINNGTFSAGTGMVTFNGTDQIIGGSSISTFYDLAITGTSSRTVTVNGGTTLALASNGTLTLTGATNNLLTLQSSDTSDWNLQVSPINTTITISYVTVSHSNAGDYKEIYALDGTNINEGNNTNWVFSIVSSPTSLGPSFLVDGSYTANNQPKLTFSLSSTDNNATIKYKIQIDNTSDFSSPVVDYTSVLDVQGMRSFTVGQAVESGSYTVGSESQILNDGAYYWRVMATDSLGAYGLYTTANSGEVAFIVDTIVPLTTDSGTDLLWHNTDVVITLSCSDNSSGCANTYFTTDGTTPTSESSSSTSVILSEDGIHLIKYFSVDNAGNNEAIKTATNTVKIDKTKPSNVNISINGGATSTTSRSVNLSISASDVTSGLSQIIISEDSSFPVALWESYSTSKTFTLSSGEGNKTVYIKFKDNADNVSEIYSDSIIVQSPIIEELVIEETEEQEVQKDIQEEIEDIKVIRLIDKEGNPLVKARVEIEGEVYITNENGEIRAVGLEAKKNYKVKIEYNGEKYETEVLGESDPDYSIEVNVVDEDISKGIEWKKILIYVGIGIVLLIILVAVYKRNKKKGI